MGGTVGRGTLATLVASNFGHRLIPWSGPVFGACATAVSGRLLTRKRQTLGTLLVIVDCVPHAEH